MARTRRTLKPGKLEVARDAVQPTLADLQVLVDDAQAQLSAASRALSEAAKIHMEKRHKFDIALANLHLAQAQKRAELDPDKRGSGL